MSWWEGSRRAWKLILSIHSIIVAKLSHENKYSDPSVEFSLDKLTIKSLYHKYMLDKTHLKVCFLLAYSGYAKHLALRM